MDRLLAVVIVDLFHRCQQQVSAGLECDLARLDVPAVDRDAEGPFNAERRPFPEVQNGGHACRDEGVGVCFNQAGMNHLARGQTEVQVARAPHDVCCQQGLELKRTASHQGHIARMQVVPRALVGREQLSRWTVAGLAFQGRVVVFGWAHLGADLGRAGQHGCQRRHTPAAVCHDSLARAASQLNVELGNQPRLLGTLVEGPGAVVHRGDLDLIGAWLQMRGDIEEVVLVVLRPGAAGSVTDPLAVDP